MPGAHIINSSDSKSSLYVDGVENISITVQYSSLQRSSSIPKIACMCHCAFSIEVHNVTNLLLRNFEITGCSGQTLTESEDPELTSASIKIVNSSNVRINGIGVHRGNATGLFLLQSHDNIAIVHSEFSKNRIDCFFRFNEANNTVKTEASNVKVLNDYY